MMMMMRTRGWKASSSLSTASAIKRLPIVVCMLIIYLARSSYGRAAASGRLSSASTQAARGRIRCMGYVSGGRMMMMMRDDDDGGRMMMKDGIGRRRRRRRRRAVVVVMRGAGRGGGGRDGSSSSRRIEQQQQQYTKRGGSAMSSSSSNNHQDKAMVGIIIIIIISAHIYLISSSSSSSNVHRTLYVIIVPTYLHTLSSRQGHISRLIQSMTTSPTNPSLRRAGEAAAPKVGR